MTTSKSPSAAYAAAVAPAGDRPHDITVFGCTGNAGRAVAYHVIRSATTLSILTSTSTPSAPLRVGLAGRDRTKVQDTLHGICTELGISPGDDIVRDTVKIVVADASDMSTMTSMAKSSRVVVGCAGPYGRYGEATVRACVEGGAHYVDITGEVPWVSRMITDYDDQAKRAGVCLLPFSGYDCVPAELGMYLAGRALETSAASSSSSSSSSSAPGDNPVLGQINLAFRNKGGGFPRGTLNTLLDGFDGNAPERKEGDVRFYPREYRTVAKTALSPSGFVLPRWSNQLGTYTGPNFMAAINVPILCRAAPTFGFSSDLVISDRSVVSGKPSLLNAYGLIPTQLYITALVMSGLALVLPPVRWWLRRSLKTYSYGGDSRGRVVMDAEAVSAGGGAATATARLCVPGDAGIYATGLFAASVANALHEVTSIATKTKQRTSMPPAGFHSPVAALHRCRPGLLVDNLKRLGADVTVKAMPNVGGEGTVVDATKL